MRKAVTSVLLYFIFVTGGVSAQSNYPKDYFGPPLDGPLIVVGSFGEIRPDHLHSGIDLSTGEQEGKNVYAAAAGYVSRIKIAPDGFGKAIYITHPNGYVTVYGHLKKFNPVFEKYITKLQYEHESFAIDQYPKPGELPVKKGEEIAFSGSTGGAEGPHLHFEIRDAKTEWTINPLLFGYKITDVVPPKISRVKIYSLYHQGVVINEFESASYKVSDESGQNKVLGPQVFNVFGNIGLGIEASDKMNPLEKNYGLGIYSIELKVDDNSVYYFHFDKFSFDESRYANAHADYEEEILRDAKIQRCYRLPGNKLSIDADTNMKGELILEDGEMHSAEFIVTDFAGNSSSLYVALKSHPPLGDLLYPVHPAGVTVISESKGININTEDIHLRIPAGAVYEETWFSFSKSSGSKGALSALHHVGEITVAVQNPLNIEIKVTGTIAPALQQKTVIVSHRKNGTLKYEGGEWRNGFVSASVRSFGDFEVMLDTTPPAIKPVAVPPATTSQDGEIQISLLAKDNLSGIGTYRATIDGKFFLLEFDAKSGMFSGAIPNWKAGKKHNFALSVSDKRGNSVSYTTTLTF